MNPYFDEHNETRVEMGQQSYQLFQSSDDPAHVVVIIEFDSKSRARAYMESEDLREKMQEAGVKGKPTISFLSQVEQQSVRKPSA